MFRHFVPIPPRLLSSGIFHRDALHSPLPGIMLRCTNIATYKSGFFAEHADRFLLLCALGGASHFHAAELHASCALLGLHNSRLETNAGCRHLSRRPRRHADVGLPMFALLSPSKHTPALPAWHRSQSRGDKLPIECPLLATVREIRSMMTPPLMPCFLGMLPKAFCSASAAQLFTMHGLRASSPSAYFTPNAQARGDGGSRIAKCGRSFHQILLQKASACFMRRRHAHLGERGERGHIMSAHAFGYEILISPHARQSTSNRFTGLHTLFRA